MDTELFYYGATFTGTAQHLATPFGRRAVCGAVIFGPAVAQTDDPSRVVTCQNCKATHVYKEAVKQTTTGDREVRGPAAAPSSPPKVGRTLYGKAAHLGHNRYPLSTAVFAVCGAGRLSAGRLYSLNETDDVVHDVTCMNCKATFAFREARAEQLENNIEESAAPDGINRAALGEYAKVVARGMETPALKLRAAVYELPFEFTCGDPLLAYVDGAGDITLGAASDDTDWDDGPISDDAKLELTRQELRDLIAALTQIERSTLIPK